METPNKMLDDSRSEFCAFMQCYLRFYANFVQSTSIGFHLCTMSVAAYNEKC
jgi:hypothetical protein